MEQEPRAGGQRAQGRKRMKTCGEFGEDRADEWGPLVIIMTKNESYPDRSELLRRAGIWNKKLDLRI